LVKKGRARWVAEDMICLLGQPEEDNTMKSATVEAVAAAAPEQVMPEPVQLAPTPAQAETESAAPPPIDGRLLQELAKRRLAAKRNLTGQLLDYLLLIISAFFMVNAAYYPSALFAVCLCLFWGLRLAYRAFKFMKPAFKEGMAAYFRKRKEQQLEFECNRLKQMSAEFVANELNK
jgi:hypothetical protein